MFETIEKISTRRFGFRDRAADRIARLEGQLIDMKERVRGVELEAVAATASACPHCGGRPRIEESRDAAWACCRECGLRSSKKSKEVVNPFFGSFCAPDFTAAIEAWNNQPACMKGV